METREHPLLSCANAARRAVRHLTTGWQPRVEEAATADQSDSEPRGRTWARNLATAAVVGSLGVALAGAVATAGTADTTNTNADVRQPAVRVSLAADVDQPVAFGHQESRTDRSAARGALADRQAANRAREARIDQQQARAAQESRSKKLGAAVKAAQENDKRLSSRIPSQMPVGNYTITGRWGAVGPWARYHTGVDFAAPVGSTIVAPATGVVEHVGSGGKAGSWAGCYVVVRHNDGQASLYAHMSCGFSVTVGQTVTAGTPLGQVGMTGRTFGPHLHMELYPAGAVPGDIYTSIDPLPWLQQGS